jgi:hypothetical protein
MCGGSRANADAYNKAAPGLKARFWRIAFVLALHGSARKKPAIRPPPLIQAVHPGPVFPEETRPSGAYVRPRLRPAVAGTRDR